MDRFAPSVVSRAHSDLTGRTPVYTSTPERIGASQLTAFTAFLRICTGQPLPDYEALHDFSVREFRTFWQCFVQWSLGLNWSGNAEPVCIGDDCEHANFFPQMQLNYADNLLGLSVASPDAPALTACHADGRRVRLTRAELRERVARLAHALSELGLGEGDRVVGVMRNDADAVVTALAVTALGATMSTAAPEMGVDSIRDRFEPLAPRLLFAHTAARTFDTGRSVASNVADLAAALPSLQGVVCLDDGTLPSTVTQSIYSLGELLDAGDADRFVWRRFAFNHPLFIMFSSGTTGKPKCIVHGTGGTLIEHLKEHRLHSDLGPGDRMYFHTSCAWMMWNWQLSALASGVEIVTYDGPISTVDTLWRLIAEERVTVFGTSPAYLKMSEDAGVEPKAQFDLGALRAILSTGAVLYDAQFEWVRDHVKPLPLQSISGGTDIIGCFVLGNPNLPVYAGEAQCRSLALDVQAWDQGSRIGGVGQLVCVNAFPSRPLGFFGDAEGDAFHAAYFASNPGVWTHGDLISLSPEGAVRMHGRSDGVLNVRGINVGPGEIYRVLNDIPEIREAMVVEQKVRDASAGHADPENVESRVVLLLVLNDGAALSGALAARVRRDLARRASPAHVPDRIIAVDALPITHNGKLSEAAARSAVNGLPIGNAAALRNPECLEAIRRHPALNLATRELPPVGESREQLERYLQALWEKLFGVAPIGRDDNFFDLGGHSLLATRLLADVRQSTGRTIPLAMLMIAPTITRLAALICDDALPPSSPTLVRVRAGTGMPLFLIHSASGSVMECLALIGSLKSPRPVYGLLARGLDGEQPALLRVEDMAASYIEQMRTVQPKGPYAVAGYSFGGLVAFEIAQQLRRAGEQIELLFLLDTYVDEHCRPWTARLRRRAGSVRAHWQTVRELPAARLPGYVKDRFAGVADQIRMRVGRMALRPEGYTAVLPPAMQHMRETMRVAMTTYRPKPYDAGPIVYVRAAVSQSAYGDPMLLWRRVARAGLVVAEVSGGHADLIVEPNVQFVAAALDRGLGE
ncbi:acetoacetate--CoA ligase [Paraburkholderia madseniana]|uniref:Acetoacetate--CoA ligase n=1 Tax=Paraburkholderia madseniana TaxID=2599607 RepID=A0AAP5ELG2_9BURK|nr:MULTISPECIES: acetoacetate--CoA ligase [Paraburkholderia]MCX4144238.1 acetoacetate--CoA ligase [Paraburkholderia madseniana]MDN7147191.1 acetoacetate--CoA ligase [Paraburkholderia sp. WS6]MDQ6406071.1 acetoacetate--CoA ligase [Paraburkholderia madseniana]